MFNYKFNHIQYREGMGKFCPALTDMETGGIIINADLWPHLTAAEQREVLAHEEGHWVLSTFDERKADEYSLLKQFREGHPLHEAVAAMEKLLDQRNPDHQKRISDRKLFIQQLNNQRNHYKEPTMSTNTKQGCGCADCNHSKVAPYGILGICLSKKCKEKKAAKQQENRDAKNEAKVLLAAQGVKSGLGGVLQDIGAGLGGLISTAKEVAPAVAAIAGGTGLTSALTDTGSATSLFSTPGNAAQQSLGNNAQADMSAYIAAMEQEAADKKKKTTTWIIIGVVAVVVVGAIIFFVTRKKSA